MIQRILFLLALISAVFGITLGVDASRRGLMVQQFPATPVDPVLAFSPPPKAWLAMTNLAAVATDVTYIPDRTGNWHAAVATNSANPQATNNGVYFNGASDWLSFNNWNAPTETFPGITNATTGLCYDPRDDTLWRGDFVTGELVNCNQAGRQIARVSTSVGVENLQGIALVPSTGDFWLMDVVDTTIFQVDSAGATLFSTNVGATYAPAGVCYDATSGRLHILATSGVIYTYNEADFSFVGSVTGSFDEPDGIWIGTNGNFFVSQDGAAFNDSAVLEIDPSDGSLLNTFDLDVIVNIEHGCQLPNGRVYIGVDDLYHAGGIRVDYLARLKSDFTFYDIGRDTTGVTIIALLKPSANPTTGRYPVYLSTGADAALVRSGLALGLTSGKMSAAGRKNDGGSAGVSTTSPSVSTTEYTLISAVLDYENATASVYTNGVLCSQNTSFFTAGSSTNSLSRHSAIGSSSVASYFAGELVHVFMWNEALDATENADFKAVILP